MFIKEAMRYYSPVPGIGRKSSSPIKLGGHIIPPNLRIDINLYAIHHHPDVWKDPEVCVFTCYVLEKGNTYVFLDSLRSENTESFL